MQSQAQRLISRFRTIVLAAVTALLITSAALPMSAQNSVPASASQAARMPEFAKRLAHPATPRMPAKSPVSVPSDRGRRLPPVYGIAYDNGPVNGQVDAWTINFGFAASDTIQVNGSVSIQFWAWLEPGDTITNVEVQIGSSGYFSNNLFDGVVSLTQSSCFTNDFGFDVCLVSGNFTGPTLNGNDWITLANANTADGNPVYWDENSGVGCMSPGCPSQAQENTIGTIPSEAFTLQGYNNGPPACFESGGNLQIISNFTQQQAGSYPGPSGVVIDHAGNLYGTTYAGGDNSDGFAYKLARFAGWLLDPLFSFFGGNSGGEPSGVIVGPNGSLYGGAQGGIQNCGTDGSQYCGLVFNLTPQPTACANVQCSWDENVPYRFSSEGDGSGTINVSASDQQGNLYGTTSTGGAYDAGTVFELTPSGGGWTKATLYSFTGGVDANPIQVLVGNDGNLYGVAGAMHSNGIVFQLAPSGGQWTESVLYAFSGEQAPPSSLVQDSTGNLYGIVSSWEFGPIFTLQKTSSGWTFSQFLPANEHGSMSEFTRYDWPTNLTIDAAGNLYGTGGGGTQDAGSFGKRSPGFGTCFYNYIFKASYNGGWHYQDLDFLDNTYFNSGGSLAVDTSGNFYGTTTDCGTNNSGTVWQVSP